MKNKLTVGLNDPTESKDFILLQKKLLKHKFLYYIQSNAEITDYEYDMLEKSSFEMAKNLGFRADKWEDAEANESHHIHWMIGFDYDSPYWEDTKLKFKL